MRRREIELSIDLIRQVLKGMPEGPVAAKLPNLTEWRVSPGECYSRVESSRGEYGYYVVSDGSLKPRRVHVAALHMSMPLHCLRGCWWEPTLPMFPISW